MVRQKCSGIRRSYLGVPVIAALAIPENRRAETDRAIKVELNFIMLLRFPALITRS